MKKQMMLTIAGTQRFGDEPPEHTELVTEAEMELQEGVLLLSYEESELTGMEGTTTTFRIEPDRLTLVRTGAVQSRMVFAEGEVDKSLYNTGFGAMMISVRTEKLELHMDENGGEMTVAYAISIEDDTAGYIRYAVQAHPKPLHA